MNIIRDYFNAEKFESLFFIFAGILAIGLSIYFWFVLKEAFYRGIAVPLVLVAAIQITVGTTVYLRSPKDIIRVENILAKAPKKVQSEEIPRMETVMKNFVIYRYVEIALILLGIGLFYFSPHQSFLRGIGLGLMVQAGVMLFLDYFAESRGIEYLNFLKNL